MSGTSLTPKHKPAAKAGASPATEPSKEVRALTERVQQLEDALQDADACLRGLMNAMPPCIFFKDRESRFLAVNQAFAGLLGRTPAELVGKNDFDFFPAELATKYQADDQRIMASQQTEKIEEANQVGDERRVVEVMKTPVTREDGEVIGLMGAFTDITFRRRTEEALDRERDLLRALLETVPDRVYFKDRQSRFVRCSDELARFHGKQSPAELIGKSDFDLFTEEHARPAFEDEKRIMTTGEGIIGKIEKETFANGRVTWVLTSKMPHRDKLGKVIGTFGISRDITNLKLTEDELKRSQTFMNSVIENLPIMVFIKDAQLRFVLLNKAGEELTGYPREVFVGKTDADLYPPELAEAYSARDRETLAGAKLVDIPEETLETRHRGQRFLHTRKIPIRDEEGRPLYLLGISEDITERKEAEEQVRRFTARLEQHNRELQDFVYVASHDLQEPLRKVQAFGDRLKSRCAEQLSAQGRDYLERVQDAARRMQTLLEDLLTYSRVTTRANPFMTVDLNEIVRDVTSEMEEALDAAQAQVEVERLPKIDADPVQMRQLIQQLLSNALKFRRNDVPPRVKIHSRIVTSARAPGLERLAGLDFNLNPRNPHCLISVEDNGIGFDEKYVDRIFVVFQRLHGRGTYDGTGVGLAICRKIILRHNGEITATSRPNQGSTFLLLLPVKQAKAIPTAEPAWERAAKK
jgi:PAS domain S-box-containing protein